MAKSFIGKNARTEREAKGLTRKALAEKSGVREDWIVDLELGGIASPGIDKLLRVAEALQISIDKLVMGEIIEGREIRFSLDPKAKLTGEELSEAHQIMEGVLRGLEQKAKKRLGEKS